MTEIPRTTGDSASVGELLGDIARDLSTLVRQEMELAKAELRQSAKQSGKGAGLLSAAGLIGYLALAFVAIAAWWGLGEVMNRGWAALIVAVVLAVIAAALGATGRKEMRNVTGLPETTDTVKRIPDAVKGNEGSAR